MVMPAEVTGGLKESRCSACGGIMPLEVLSSNAGYYLGYKCDKDGPQGRESCYFSSYEHAEMALHRPKDFLR